MYSISGWLRLEIEFTECLRPVLKLFTNDVAFVVHWIPKFQSLEFIIPRIGKSFFL